MKIRSILYILFVASIIGVFFYLSNSAKKTTVDVNTNSISKSILQLTPMPIIISQGNGYQNTVLYDMLVNKSGNDVLLQDVTVDLGGFDKFFPFDAKHLTIEFKYNPEKERLEFSGSDLQGQKIYGHCLFTNKNNIHYSIHFDYGQRKLEIKFVHNPNGEDTNESTNGTFIFTSSIRDTLGMIFGTNYAVIEDKALSLRGKFVLNDNNVALSNLNFQGEDTNTTVKLDLPTDSALPVIKIKASHTDLDLDKIIDNFGIVTYDVTLFQELMRKLKDVSFQVSLTSETLQYNGAMLKHAVIDVDNNNNGDIQFNKFSFELAKNSYFTTKGIILNSKTHPQYDGNITLKNANYSDLAKILSLSPVENKQDTKVEFSSSVVISPSLLIFKDLTIQEGDFILKSALFRYSFFTNSNNIITGDVRINKGLEKSNLVNAITNKYGEYLRRQDDRDIIDLNMYFGAQSKKHKDNNRIILGARRDSNDIALNYIATTELINFKDIVFSNRLNGHVTIDVNSGLFTGNFSGNDVSLRSFNKLVQDIEYINNISSINNQVYSSNKYDFKNMHGTVKLAVKNKAKQDFQGLNCTISYADNKAQLTNCVADIFGGKMDVSGSIGLDKGQIYYDLSYSGNGLLLPALISSETLSTGVIQGVEGKFDIQGSLKSKGNAALELEKNMVGTAALKFHNAKLKGVTLTNHLINDQKLESGTQTQTKINVLTLSKGNIDFGNDTVMSTNFEATTDTNGSGHIGFTHDLVQKLTKIVLQK